MMLFALLAVACGQDQKQHVPPEPTPVPVKVLGQEIFERNCAYCHGISGKGDGPAAANLPVKPKNLTLTGTQEKSGEELTRIITKGIRSEELDYWPMPSWGGQITPQEIREVVQYLRYLGRK